MDVKAAGQVVLGINHKCINRRIGSHRPSNRIDDQDAADAATLKPLIDRQPTDQTRRDRGVSWQSPDLLGRQLGERNAGRGKGVVARDRGGRIERGEAVAQPPSNILANEFPEIPVERRNTTGKVRSVVLRAQEFDGKRLGHSDALTTRR